MTASDASHAPGDDARTHFIRAAQHLRERIRRSTEDAGELRAAIAVLQGATEPDHPKIQLLEKELSAVEQQIKAERAGLKDFELEISLNY